MMVQRRIELTVKEYARRERVTVRTVRHWIAKGAVEIRRTPGGGVRIFMLTDDAVNSGEDRGSPSN